MHYGSWEIHCFVRARCGGDGTAQCFVGKLMVWKERGSQVKAHIPKSIRSNQSNGWKTYLMGTNELIRTSRVVFSLCLRKVSVLQNERNKKCSWNGNDVTSSGLSYIKMHVKHLNVNKKALVILETFQCSYWMIFRFSFLLLKKWIIHTTYINTVWDFKFSRRWVWSSDLHPRRQIWTSYINTGLQSLLKPKIFSLKWVKN
jgi:hypothetical protein